jgi:Glycosyltransferase family 28 N-terminal domain
MRILFSCTSTEGHVTPLVSLARAFSDLGHEVAFATAPAFEARVRSDGFATLPAGLDQAQIMARMQKHRPRLLALTPAERQPVAYTTRFAVVDAPAKLPELLRVAKDWRPELSRARRKRALRAAGRGVARDTVCEPGVRPGDPGGLS